MSSVTATQDTIGFRYRLERPGFVLDVDGAAPLCGITGIFGESGAGKTSLLRCIAGLEQASTARLTVAGKAWDDSDTGYRLPAFERAVGYVFQEPRLFPHLDVARNLAYGARRSRRPSSVQFDDVVQLLGLGALLERKPGSLSGGEAQRVAIGRALLSSPNFMLMDEPLSSLDQARRLEILPYIAKLHASFGIPVLYVSHNIDEICALCDELLVLEEGRLVAAGRLEEVLLKTELPVMGGSEAGAVLGGSVASYDAAHELAKVVTPGGALFVQGRHHPGEKLRLRIRANDVSVARVEPQQSSILNRLRVSVTDVRPEPGSAVLLLLDAAGMQILSRITRRSLDELAIRPGDSLIAQIKSVSVRQASRVEIGSDHGNTKEE